MSCAGARTVVVDRSEAARKLAKDLGAHHVLDGGPDVVEELKELTGGGAHAVIDFVGRAWRRAALLADVASRRDPLRRRLRRHN